MIHKLYNEADGTTAIEFAIVAPIFFILVFGIAIYGTYFASLSLVNHIAFEAARATITGLSDDERHALAEARAAELIDQYSGFLDPRAITVDAAAQSNGIYGVAVHYRFNELGLGAATILPLPPADETATYAVSHGGY